MSLEIGKAYASEDLIENELLEKGQWFVVDGSFLGYIGRMYSDGTVLMCFSDGDVISEKGLEGIHLVYVGHAKDLMESVEEMYVKEYEHLYTDS